MSQEETEWLVPSNSSGILSYALQQVSHNLCERLRGMGKLICTSLVERTISLIRYQISVNAIGVDRLCSSGQTTPLMIAITGRTHNFIFGRDGWCVGLVNRLLNSIVGIREIQFGLHPSSPAHRILSCQSNQLEGNGTP
jgi:hypothetical protein